MVNFTAGWFFHFFSWSYPSLFYELDFSFLLLVSLLCVTVLRTSLFSVSQCKTEIFVWATV